MKLKYAVHNLNVGQQPALLELKDGGMTRAIIPMLLVELVPVEQLDAAGTIKLALEPTTENMKVFESGSVVLTVEPAGA